VDLGSLQSCEDIRGVHDTAAEICRGTNFLSLNEIALVSGGIALGVASGSLIAYFYTKRARTINGERHGSEKEPKFLNISDKEIQRLIPKSKLEQTRRELKTLLLEKDLVSAALTRLYEAEVAHEITREEREILSLKYTEELKALNEKILKIDAFVEVGDLETLREQLIELVTQKMDAIERRIERTRANAGPLLSEIIKPPTQKGGVISKEKKETPRIPDISDMISTQVENGPTTRVGDDSILNTEKTTMTSADINPDNKRISPVKKTGESDVEQIQKELLEALDKLEKLDIES
jgi:hypothetical protein